MDRLLLTENDWSRLLDREPAESPRISVVIPVYNRVGLLQRTLAGIAAQEEYPVETLEVLVVDDGSDEDVAAAVDQVDIPCPIAVLRQDRNGYGAGRARNLGARRAIGDVLLFIDADCMPSPHLLKRHSSWHARSRGLAVIGGRRFADTTDIDIAAMEAGWETVDPIARTDWRSVLYRRTSNLRWGTEAYRAFLSGNVSLRRADFEIAGGFDQQFARWGGEDTELGWRLSEMGLLLVPDDAAAIYHQEQEDEGDPGWRRSGRRENEGRLIDSIPHRFYRKDVTQRHRVPKVSVVVAPAAGPRTLELWNQLRSQRMADFETAFPLDSIDVADDRLVALDDAAGSDEQRVMRALTRSRGQYVAIVSGAAAPGPVALERLVALLDDTPRAAGGRCRYEGVDTTAGDAAWGFRGLPALAVYRRREWARALVAGDLPTVLQRLDAMITLQAVAPDPLAALPEPTGVAPASIAPPSSPEVAAAEAMRRGGAMRRLVYRMAQSLRRRLRRGGDARRRVGHLGDEASEEAVRRALTWANVTDKGRMSAVLIGGGAMLDDGVVDSFRVMDSPRLERMVVGAEISRAAGPATASFLSTCLAVGLATADDVARATELGFTTASVVGHPANGGADPMLALLEDAVTA